MREIKNFLSMRKNQKFLVNEGKSKFFVNEERWNTEEKITLQPTLNF